jgi:hypothetical protein
MARPLPSLSPSPRHPDDVGFDLREVTKAVEPVCSRVRNLPHQMAVSTH